MTRALALVCTLPLLFPAAAQESGRFKLAEHVFNAGGHPDAGVVLSSTDYRMTLDAVGDGVAGAGASSASFIADVGFGAAYRPPGEVAGLRFLDATSLRWDAERSVGVYHLYRDLTSNLASLDYGSCWQSDLPTTAATDLDPVPVGDGFFYLVTAENRLGEEGTKGSREDGSARGGTACP